MMFRKVINAFMDTDCIDPEGYRANVGIILTNNENKLLLGGRIGAKGWQFPQGGLHAGESSEEAMFRELREEVGLAPNDVDLLGCTRDWLRYRLPDQFIRKKSEPLCIGQKQRWYMLRLIGDDERVQLDKSDSPEFDRWRWVDYWRPVNEVIYFKRRVYALALHELGPLIYEEGVPARPRWWPRRWRVVFDKDIKRQLGVDADGG
jgi:putative (di)nucleoside polyphosphate hydrolase